MREKLKQAVEQAVKEELERSINEYGHPLFNSDHEGYAVLLEEVEEAEERLNQVRDRLGLLWIGIRENDDSYVEHDCLRVLRHAEELIAESIQVAAMAQKFIDSSKMRQKALESKE